MSVNLYDDAILVKLNKLFPENKTKILKPDETTRFFEMRAHQESDEPLTFPIITLARDPSINFEITGKRALSCDGEHRMETEQQTVQLDAIPMNLTYQLDLYTETREDGDNLLRDVIFQLVNHPKIQICIPYNNANILHDAYIKLEGNITDNSAITERLFNDQFTRWTIRFTINDAFLFSVPVRVNRSIEIDTLLLKSQNPNRVEEVEILNKSNTNNN